jgi:phenylpropionate dioxygenase-like ring-hydroxylating dioxygenase large terminal subunit
MAMIIDGIDMQPGRAPFPRNQWYVAAFGSELTREPLHRMLFGDPVVLYRQEDGTPVALFDRCPHRGMRLSNGGKLVGDNIQCHYHGIQFRPNGRACLVPSGGGAATALSIRRYPLQEVSGWIWAWAGDPERADPTLIPDHRELGLSDPTLYAYFGARLDAASNYLVSFENLVDATHITFLHHGLIDSGNVASHPYKVEASGVRVRMIRVFERELLPEMLVRSMQLSGGPVNRTLDLISYAPNVCIVKQHYVECDRPELPSRDMRLVFAITPAGPKSCYQFVGVAQSFENRHPALFEDLRRLLMEDVVALDDIQKLFDFLEPDRVPEVSVRSDEGAIRTRRIIARQIAAERTAVQAVG